VAELGGAAGIDRFRDRCGLPLATYFSGPKVTWLLDNVPGLRERAEAGDLLFGTMDSWLVWKLTGRHLTDVTNAGPHDADEPPDARLGTTCCSTRWACRGRCCPRSARRWRSTARRTALGGLPVAAALGDQHAALFGQTCFGVGDAKCTYGTGSFLLMNTGSEPIWSSNGLLTTVGYKIGDQPATYALEGSIAVTGALVQWFRDKLGLIGSAPEIETLARTVEDNGGCYFVPAFSGLFAPHWRSDARGRDRRADRLHHQGPPGARGPRGDAWQTREVVDAMNSDAGVELSALKVDGGMTANNLLMQFLADVLDVPVVRPIVAENGFRSARPTPPAWRSASGPTLTACGPTGTAPPSGCRGWIPRCATRAIASGARRSRGRSTGSTKTTTDRRPASL